MLGRDGRLMQINPPVQFRSRVAAGSWNLRVRMPAPGFEPAANSSGSSRPGEPACRVPGSTLGVQRARQLSALPGLNEFDISNRVELCLNSMHSRH